jgi:pyruvate kinase
LVDLQGPKHRLGILPEPCALAAGASFVLGRDIPLGFDVSVIDIREGHRVLIADGTVECSVVGFSDGLPVCSVLRGGVVSSRKGVNLPDSLFGSGAVTDKDRAVIDALSGVQVDWFALSFVESPDDVVLLRSLLPLDVGVMSKIERPVAVERFNEIALVSDAVLVARGDLGVEMPLEDIPSVQSELLSKSRSLGVPAVCATEMFESMIRSSRPTRAEVTDVATAVAAGFDAVMLSAETASGDHPVAAVEFMAKVRDRAEANYSGFSNHPASKGPARAVASSAASLAASLGCDAVLALTASGHTARMLSAVRPSVPIVAVTPSELVARRMNLLWGVVPLVAPRRESIEESAAVACNRAESAGFVSSGGSVVVCGSRLGPTSDADAIWVQHL